MANACLVIYRGWLISEFAAQVALKVIQRSFVECISIKWDKDPPFLSHLQKKWFVINTCQFWERNRKQVVRRPRSKWWKTIVQFACLPSFPLTIALSGDSQSKWDETDVHGMQHPQPMYTTEDYRSTCFSISCSCVCTSLVSNRHSTGESRRSCDRRASLEDEPRPNTVAFLESFWKEAVCHKHY